MVAFFRKKWFEEKPGRRDALVFPGEIESKAIRRKKGFPLFGFWLDGGNKRSKWQVSAALQAGAGKFVPAKFFMKSPSDEESQSKVQLRISKTIPAKIVVCFRLIFSEIEPKLG